MNPKLMISFAAGLIVSAGVCGSVYYAGSNNETSDSKSVAAISENEMKEQLTKKGYVILSDEEFQKITGPVDVEGEETSKEESAETEQKEQNSTETETTETKEKETEVNRTTVTVAEGMTSIDVGKALQQAGYIENAFNFTKIVEDRGLANKLRPGTYEVNSQMSIDQLLATFFK
jgi:hypothetical protein